MNIAVDISQITHQGTGVARYTENLVRSVCERDTINEYTFFFSSLRGSVPAEIQSLIKKKHRLVTIKLPPTILALLWNQLHICSIETFVGPQDVVISSDWTQPPSKAKKVTVVHDLVYLTHPETLHPKIASVQKMRMRWVKQEVDLIIADSQSTKKDLVELLKIEENRIKVVYPAVSIPSDFPSSHFPPTSKPYILSVGKLEPRKNIPRLISAFQKANLDNVDLLIVGPKGWETADDTTGGGPRQRAEYRALTGTREQQDPRVRLLGYIPDKNLYELYKGAQFFVYPSLYEGFGYPVVEAMVIGCPVATSNTSSLKEIAEEASLLFDPTNENDIANAIKKLHTDTKLREELVKKGLRRAAIFSPQKFQISFLKTIEVLRRGS